jgi:hypothetical protein
MRSFLLVDYSILGPVYIGPSVCFLKLYIADSAMQFYRLMRI